MTSSPSDIATLSSSFSQQRLDDNYDYDGTSNATRQQYHFATSPGIQIQSQYNPLTSGQSPLKNKSLRGGLPTVRFPDFSPLFCADSASYFPSYNSNGSIIQIIGLFLPTIIQTCLPLAVLLLLAHRYLPLSAQLRPTLATTILSQPLS